MASRRSVLWLSLGVAWLAVASPARGEEEDDDELDVPEPAASSSKGAPSPQPRGRALHGAVERDGMAHVPGGSFTMGSRDPKAPANERPARRVTVAPYWIDRTEVTVAAYRTCVTRRDCVAPARISRACTWELGDGALPISCVRWREADTFCRAVGKRLPTEAEWELAARGLQGLRFPWGGAPGGCSVAVTAIRRGTASSCGHGHPAPVGSAPRGASPFGVLDMAGNVEEWVADFYADGPTATPPSAGASHVLKGGGWMTAPLDARATARSWGSALEAGPNVGFRCARDAAATDGPPARRAK